VPVLDLEPAAREVARLLDGVTDDQLADPTPCVDTRVAALLDHLMGLSLAFTWAARKTTATEGGGGNSGPGQATVEHLDPGWRTLLPSRLSELAEAWRDPKAWEGVTEAGGVTMPAEMTGAVALDELVLHGWDLARARASRLRATPPARRPSSRSPARRRSRTRRPAAKVCSARWSMSPTTRRRSIGPSASQAATLRGRRRRRNRRRRWSTYPSHPQRSAHTASRAVMPMTERSR